MPSIREKKTVWQIRFRDRSRTPGETTVSIPKAQFPSERDANEEAERLRYLYRYSAEWDPWTEPWPGRKRRTGGPTVQEAISEYVRHKRRLGRRDQKGGWNENTARNYEANLNAFARAVGPKKSVSLLTTQDLEEHIFRDGLADATQRMYRRQLRTWVSWLEDQGYHDSLKLPVGFKPKETLKTIFTEEEMLTVCHHHRLRCIEETKKKYVPKKGVKSPLSRWSMTRAFRFAFYQCLRRGEVAAIRVGGINLQRWQMVVGDQEFVPKGRDERVVTIMPPARPIAKSLVQDRDPSERLFGRKSARKFYDAWKDAIRHATKKKEDGSRALPPAKRNGDFHSLRHSGVVHWLEAGYSYRDVKNLARHKSVTTTEGYDQYVAEGARRRAEELHQNPQI